MLLDLRVQNLALIEEEEVSFRKGLNVLTGETGAGKSILLGALSLALGGEVRRDMVRDPGRDAFAEAVFSVGTDAEREAFRAIGIEPEDDEVILSRRITDTRTAARINGETVPSKKLKAAGKILIDIYGQREHQSLLDPKKHLALLDEYAGQEMAEKKAALADAYSFYAAKKKELDEADTDASTRAREADFLQMEIREIEEADLREGEDTELEDRYRRMKNAEKIAEALTRAGEALTEGEVNASDLAGTAVEAVSGALRYDEEGLSDIASAARDAESMLSDLGHSISAYLEGMEFDSAAFQETESRLDLVNTLKMKYGGTIDAVQEALAEKKDRLEKLSDYDTYLSGLNTEVQALREKLSAITAEVSSLRHAAAEPLARAITGALSDLNFSDVQFAVHFEELPQFTRNGIDSTDFMISLNAGEPLRPLEDVASGGELSRIMLAVKTVFSDLSSVDTMIFDEIDAGISGRTAQKVSEKLAEVAMRHQVICITHLPQIAAMADAHFLVEKEVHDGETTSSIRELTELDKVDELSRMLGGTEITDAVRMNAEEMLALAEKRRKGIRNGDRRSENRE